MRQTDNKTNIQIATPPLSSGQLDTLLCFHGFNLNAEDKNAVQTHLQIISTHANNLLSFPLAEAIESAPIYRP